jgi:dTDP-4-amino-4,6-dideoxygalactose transaminase
VFVDIDPFSFTMDPGCLEVALAKGCSGTIRPVKAIMPVHAFGRMAAMPEIQAIAERYGVTVVEDAACAFGATTEGRPAGTWGRLGCFSFHPRKSVTTGEGGVTVTSDHALDARLRMLRNHGQDPSAQAPDFVMAGWNYRMTDMQGALGVTQLAKADRIIEARRDAARRYDGLLRTLPVETPGPVGNDHTFQSYVVLLDADVSVPREEVIRRLRSRMVEAAIGTWHLPLTTHFRSQYAFAPGDFPVTDDVFARSLTLPLYESIDLSTQQAVVAALSDSLATP